MRQVGANHGALGMRWESRKDSVNTRAQRAGPAPGARATAAWQTLDHRTDVQASHLDHFHYELVTVNRAGLTRVHEYASDDPLAPGDVISLDGRFWLVESVEANEAPTPRAVGKPARYQLVLRHPDGREERGVFRRFRQGAPRVGHAFTTEEDKRPISWEVVDAHLSYDEQGEPYLELVAERDFEEVEELPDHELEHTLARKQDEELPDSAAACSPEPSERRSPWSSSGSSPVRSRTGTRPDASSTRS